MAQRGGVIIEKQAKIGHEPANAAAIMRAIGAFKKQKAKEQGEEKPFLSFNRHVMWDLQPCKFCGSTELPSEVKGRYFSENAQMDDDGDETVAIFFCGNCLNILEAVMQTEMN